MISPRAFLSLEASFAKTVSPVWSKTGGAAADALLRHISAGEWGAAYELANGLTLDGVAAQKRSRLEELAISALLFGGHLVAGRPADTAYVARSKPLPPELSTAVEQFINGIEANGTDLVRAALMRFLDEEEDKAKSTELQKTDTLAERLNAAVLGTGKMAIDVGANLTTSRLITLGFLSEAIDRQITTYQVNEVLDSRTCTVCQYMHGKTFEVTQEFSRTILALSSADPNDLKQLAPWPSRSREGLRELNSMRAESMQVSGFGSPPYHPGCRGMLAVAGTITETIQLGGMPIPPPPQAPQPSSSPKPQPEAVAVDPMALQAKIANLSDPALKALAYDAFDSGDFAEVERLLAVAD